MVVDIKDVLVLELRAIVVDFVLQVVGLVEVNLSLFAVLDDVVHLFEGVLAQ